MGLSEFLALGGTGRAQHHRGAVPDCVSREWLLAQCAIQERVLRLQEDGDALSEDEDAQVTAERLAAEADPSPAAALGFYKYLGHLFIVRDQRLVAMSTTLLAGDEAASALLQRVPVEVRLESGRRVQVTGRALATMLLMAGHGARAQLLEVELDACQERYVRALAEGKRLGWMNARGRQWKRRARALQRAHQRYTTELVRQRVTMWAHALTADGAPHPIDVPVEPWLAGITPLDEKRLFEALEEVGPRRIAALIAAMPKPKRRRGSSESERRDYGPEGLLAAYGYRMKVRAADCYDLDLGYVTAEVVVNVPEPMEEMDG